MAISGGMTLARWLGIVVLVLAWTAAAIEYSNTGNIRWALIAAGIFFAAMPFAAGGKPSS
jgi:hypothetical protein